jgi:hypothetical protein
MQDSKRDQDGGGRAKAAKDMYSWRLCTRTSGSCFQLLTGLQCLLISERLRRWLVYVTMVEELPHSAKMNASRLTCRSSIHERVRAKRVHLSPLIPDRISLLTP